MLYFEKQNLVYLANPKTGTTALERALAPQAALVVAGPPGMRHVNLGAYRLTFEPFIARTTGATPQIFAVMREPLAHLLSWYRYRRRGRLRQPQKSTSDITPEAFLLETMKDDPAPFARVGSQARFLGAEKGHRLPDFLFPYEHPALLGAFVRDRFGVDAIDPANVSPSETVEVDPAVVARLRAHMAEDFALYARVLAMHGQVSPAP